MNIAYLHCFAGVSGDMLLGSVVDAGVPLKTLEKELGRLKLKGYKLSKRKVQKHHLGGTKVNVKLTRHEHAHRHLPDILSIINRSTLSARVKEQAGAVFSRLAKAEGRVHRQPYQKIHFHEVGAVDAIVDIVGTVIGMELLGVEKVYASPLTLGSGTTRAAHGVLPVPVPAVMELAKGYPVNRTDIPAELTTPTGAALVTALTGGYKPVPGYAVKKTGYGAGGRDLEQIPNLLRLEIGETADALDEDEAFMIETNVDDVSPEILGHLTGRLMQEQARDVYLTPVQMKKGRPGTMLSILTDRAGLDRLSRLVLAGTSTLGVRYYPVRRKILKREILRFKSSLGTVAVKVAVIAGQKRYAPEYEDCVKLAEKKKMELLRVYRTIEKEIGIKLK